MSELPPPVRTTLDPQELRDQRGTVSSYLVSADNLHTFVGNVTAQFNNLVGTVTQLANEKQVSADALQQLTLALRAASTALKLDLDFSALGNPTGPVDVDAEGIRALKGRPGPLRSVPGPAVSAALQQLEHLAATGQATPERVSAVISELPG